MRIPQNANLLIATLLTTLLSLVSTACSGGHPNGNNQTTPPNLAQSPEASPESTQQQRKYSLREATDNKFAHAMLCGLGASSGEAVILAIKSALADPMEISLDEGTTLRSHDGGAQDMVLDRVAEEYDGETTKEIAKACVEAAEREEKRIENQQNLSEGWRKTDIISLPPYETRVYLVRAYCLDFEKENPSAGTRFSLSNDANAETEKVFKYLRQNPTAFDTPAIQLATWAVNGDFGPEEIGEKFEFDESERRNACSLLQRAGVNVASKKLCAN